MRRAQPSSIGGPREHQSGRPSRMPSARLDPEQLGEDLRAPPGPRSRRRSRRASNVAATTYCGSGRAPAPRTRTGRRGRRARAVPVLPATGIGKPLEHAGTRCRRARWPRPRRPSRMAWRYSGLMSSLPGAGRLELLERAAAGVLDPLAQLRLHDACPPLAIARVGHGQLQRVGLQVALAHRRGSRCRRPTTGGRVRLPPGLLRSSVGCATCGASGRQARGLVRAGRCRSARPSPSRGPTSGSAGRCPLPLASGAEAVEEHVAGDRSALRSASAPWTAPPAFWKLCAPTRSEPPSYCTVSGGDQAALERRRRGDQLERRARRDRRPGSRG